MIEGSFYCYVPRSPTVAGWLLTRSRSKKLVHRRLSDVISSWDDGSALIDPEEDIEAGNGSVPSTQSFIYPGGGVTVKLGLQEVAEDLYRVKPYVYNAPDDSAVIVFTGYLSNLQELSRRGPYRTSGSSPRSPHNNTYNNSNGGASLPTASSLERRSSIERSLDIGALTASTVLGLYQAQKEGGELIMLSELQGQYAFVIYDNKRKQAFAARDPSGSEPLYFQVTEDGGVSFASDPAAVPASPGGTSDTPGDGLTGMWVEVPPGHYISGRHPKLHQYALTPYQLQVREWEESLEGPLRSSSLSSSEEATSLATLTRRYSLEAAPNQLATTAAAATTTSPSAPAEGPAGGGGEEGSSGGGGAAVVGSSVAPARLQPRKSLEAELFALDL